MYLDIATKPSLYAGLRQIDEDLAARTQAARCSHCGGPLHAAAFARKPRGVDLPEPLRLRLGLCCGHCRRRTLPPSVLFWGRRVYLGAVLLVIATVWRGRLEGASALRLRQRFGVTANTLRRWRTYFARDVPVSAPFQRMRGVLSAVARHDELPGSLVAVLGGATIEAVTDALVLFATG